jgi:hypothetical protein
MGRPEGFGVRRPMTGRKIVVGIVARCDKRFARGWTTI